MDTNFELKDSGARQEFDTGSKRDTRKGKGRFDLISPFFQERLAKHMENGAEKYGDRNWEKGQPLMRYIDSAQRHMNKYLQGHRDEDHITAAAWNLMAFIHTELMIEGGVLPPELDDRPENYVNWLACAKCLELDLESKSVCVRPGTNDGPSELQPGGVPSRDETSPRGWEDDGN